MLQVVFNANSGSSSVNTNRFNPLNRILERCENIRPSGDGYRADCPYGHRSRGSLSIKQADDGRVLLHCFSGCSALEVMHGLGLELKDLFERPITTNLTPEELKRHKRAIKQSQWKAALDFLPKEIFIVQIAAVQIGKEEPLNVEDHLRLELAGKRLTSAREVLCGR